MRICIPQEHAGPRLRQRQVIRAEIERRIKLMGEAMLIDCRRRIALVGQQPPIIVDVRPPDRATVVTVLDPGARVGGLLKLPY